MDTSSLKTNDEVLKHEAGTIKFTGKKDIKKAWINSTLINKLCMKIYLAAVF